MSKAITTDETLLGPQALNDVTAGPSGHLDVVPSDTKMFYPPLREIRVGVAGDVEIRLAGSTNVVIYPAAGGEYITGQIAQILDANTTATGIIGRW